MNKYDCSLEVLKSLNNNGFEAYIVGGYPRDLYLGRISDDIDICTSATYSDLKEIFDNVVNIKYGSYILNYDDYSYDVTTFRKEKGYIGNRFPGRVTFTNSLLKDLKRRDFTINTLCIDSNGNFIDLMHARIDINHKLVKLVGGKSKIDEDSLRILRAIRFATTLHFDIDVKLSKAIVECRNNLVNLSFDRKRNELEKIFSDSNCLYGISLIKQYGLEKVLHIDLNNLVVVDDMCGIWAQILVDDLYNFSKSEKYKIKKIRELLKVPFNIMDLYKYGADILSIVYKIKGEDINIKKLYKDLVIKDRDDIDISFFDICEVITLNDQLINVIYSDIEEKIVLKELSNNKKDILKYIVENYKHF